jgi:hypothetical protein
MADERRSGAVRRRVNAPQARALAPGGRRCGLDFAASYDPTRELYEAYATRASELGPSAGRFDNTPLMGEILALRRRGERVLRECRGSALGVRKALAVRRAELAAQLFAGSGVAHA